MTQILTTKELSQLLGMSTRHLYRHRKTLKPARVSLGNALRWDADKVLEVLHGDQTDE